MICNLYIIYWDNRDSRDNPVKQDVFSIPVKIRLLGYRDKNKMPTIEVSEF